MLRPSLSLLPVIRSFTDVTTEKLSLSRELCRIESNKLGNLNPVKAFERLAILNAFDEKSPLNIYALHYHKLKGTSNYSIDANSRESPRKITFQWENLEMKNVGLVRIEDTHSNQAKIKTKPIAVPRDPFKIPKPLSNPAAALIRDTIAHHGLTQIEAADTMKISKTQLSDVIR